MRIWVHVGPAQLVLEGGWQFEQLAAANAVMPAAV